MLEPWPPIHFVAECSTTSAPCSIGLLRKGVANVLSTTSGTPAACATSATARRSDTSSPGLPMVSTYTALVVSSIAAANDDRSFPSTKRVVLPSRAREYLRSVHRPPYNDDEETIESPACARLRSASVCAACPLAVATAATPPSRSAMRRPNAPV